MGVWGKKAQDVLQVWVIALASLSPSNEREQMNFPLSWFKRGIVHPSPQACPLPVSSLGNLSPCPPESPPGAVTAYAALHTWVPPEAHVLAGRGAKSRLSSQRELCGVMEASCLGSLRGWGSLLSAGSGDPACQRPPDLAATPRSGFARLPGPVSGSGADRAATGWEVPIPAGPAGPGIQPP